MFQIPLSNGDVNYMASFKYLKKQLLLEKSGIYIYKANYLCNFVYVVSTNTHLVNKSECEYLISLECQ